MSNGQYELVCAQICQKLGLEYKRVEDGVIVLWDQSFLTLSDCAVKLLEKVKQQEEIIGELTVANNSLKKSIVEYRIREAKKDVQEILEQDKEDSYNSSYC